MNGHMHIAEYQFASHFITANKLDVIELFRQRF